jgi:predicted enzyme related to lactoylglutathione lyase
MKLAAVRIVTRDVDALVRFYRALISTEAMGSEHYAEFATSGGAVLAICSQQASDLFNPGTAMAAANRSLVISFEVADVDAERRRLARIVNAFVQEPMDLPWSQRSMLFRDPDGNLVQVFAVTAPRRRTQRRGFDA